MLIYLLHLAFSKFFLRNIPFPWWSSISTQLIVFWINGTGLLTRPLSGHYLRFPTLKPLVSHFNFHISPWNQLYVHYVFIFRVFLDLAALENLTRHQPQNLCQITMHCDPHDTPRPIYTPSLPIQLTIRVAPVAFLWSSWSNSGASHRIQWHWLNAGDRVPGCCVLCFQKSGDWSSFVRALTSNNFWGSWSVNIFPLWYPSELTG